MNMLNLSIAVTAAAALVLHRSGGMGFDSTLVGIFILLYGMPNGSMPVIACTQAAHGCVVAELSR